MNNTILKRSPKMDIIRCVAFLLVVSVHFFEYSEFTRIPIDNPRMYIWTIVRTLCITCVPMFIVLSGYLMCGKKLSKKYYNGLTKTIAVYIISCIVIFLYRTVIKHQQISVSALIKDILNFSAAPYGWYVAMYLGLFLIIPFLNLIYNNLKTKNQKLVLILTFIVLTSAPTMTNIWSPYSMSNLITPSLSDSYVNILPDWWMGLYPISYYFIGCWMKEYGLGIGKLLNFILLVAAVCAFGAFNIYRSYPGKFIYGHGRSGTLLPQL